MTQKQVTSIAWFSCICLCCSYYACIAPDPLLVGWQCTQSSDCGSAANYVCHRQRCQLSCTKDADCAPQQSCITNEGNRFCSTQINTESPNEVSKEPTSEIPGEGAAEAANEPVVDAASPDLPVVESPSQDNKGCGVGTTQACYTGPANTRNVGACKDGQQTCLTDGTWGTCTGDTLPRPEICDDIDNNCDGQIDEGIADLGLDCTAGVGECQSTGKFVCATDGINVQCDASPGAPRSEACDGKDNDCDGQTDEDFTDLGKICTSQGLGACQRQGKLVCAANGASVMCDAIDGQPSPEICNGIDDDCDGNIDNSSGNTTPIQQTCYSGPASTRNIGTCKDGIQECLNGRWTACKGEITPATKDTCKGQDDNCNGTIDEGCSCSGGHSTNCGSNVGECKQGRQTCNNGVWGACTGQTAPTPEICDGKDNDCDGQIDEGIPFSPPTCRHGTGIGLCGLGTQTCKNGQITCVPKQAPISEQCNGIDDNCNGTTDEGNPDGGGPCTLFNKKGPCAAGQWKCSLGKLTCAQTQFPQQEKCGDMIDNDCSGTIDDNLTCQPNQIRCVSGNNSQFQTCNATCTGWSPPQSCSSGSCINNKCT